MDVLKRNNVKVFGRGEQAMIFCHGFGCDQNMWRFVTANFLENFKIILFDHVGAGNSILSAYDKSKYSSLNGYAQDILEICDTLKLRNIIFVGHSVGAMMGILSANMNPEYFQKLILIGPSPCYINDDNYIGGFSRADIEEMLMFMETDYVNWSVAFASLIMGNTQHPSLIEELTNSFCNTNPEIARHFARVAFFADNRLDLPNLRIKSYILQCSEDIIAPDEVGQYMHKFIAGSCFIKLNATGHCPHLSAPLETIMALEKILEI